MPRTSADFYVVSQLIGELFEPPDSASTGMRAQMDFPMREITRINHVGLRVRDLTISRAFYEKLGFVFIVGPVGPEPVAIVEHPSGVNINLILNASEDAAPDNVLMDHPTKHAGFTHIALEITDPDGVERQLDEMGIEITERVEFGGARFFFIRDPDGNVLEFHKPSP